jgi:hypothetical protein
MGCADWNAPLLTGRKCKREGCDERDLPDGEEYCGRFCREVDRDVIPDTVPPADDVVGWNDDVTMGTIGDAIAALDAVRPAGVKMEDMIACLALAFAPEPVSSRPEYTDPVLSTDSEERKQIPIFSGVMNYFPLALAAVARLSKTGNDKHNPGEPLGWARNKSLDHEDCIARHLIDVDTLNANGEYEDATALAWRALAKLQTLEEKRLGKAPSRGSR